MALRDRIDRHIVVDFRHAASIYASPAIANQRYLFLFACGAVSVIRFRDGIPYTTTLEEHNFNPVSLVYVMSGRCNHCAMLRAVAAANHIAPADAEDFLNRVTA